MHNMLALFDYPLSIGTNIWAFIWFFPICVLVNTVVKAMKMPEFTAGSFIGAVAKSSLRGTTMILMAWVVVVVLTWLGSL